MDHSDDDTVVGFPTKEPSLVDLIKADLNELEQQAEVLIPVAGYERARLQVKYHLPESGKELDGIARKVTREVKDNYTRNLLTAIDTMIFLCSGLYAQPPDANEPLPLDTAENPGVPVMFDAELADILGIEGGSARQIVRRLFPNNEMALLNHAEKLNRWLQNTKADLNAEFWMQMGE